MATINKRKICQKHGIYNAEESKQCPLCKKQNDKTYDTQIRSKDKMKIYNSKRWKQIRDKVRIRDNFMCQECLRNGIETIGIECDHIIELEDDITKAYDIDNIELLCVACHTKKTHKEREKRK